MSTEIGKRAEIAAANWLIANEYKVLAHNWRTRWCEIDIIAEKDKKLHFVEVKYRRTAAFGAGFDYVTAEKQQRLRRAAAEWLHQNNRPEADYQIDVLSITTKNNDFEITFLPNAVTDF